MAKSRNGNGKTALAVIKDWPIFQVPVKEYAQGIMEVASGDISLRQLLPKATVPTGGGTYWMLSELGSEPLEAIEGVILAYKDSRIYWASQEIGEGPPSCTSDNLTEGHGSPGGLCETCPMNQWGSSEKSEKAKACKVQRLLLFQTKMAVAPILVQVPATSYVLCGKYFFTLLNGVGVSGKVPMLLPHNVMTTLRLTPSESKGKASKISFSAAPLPDDARKIVDTVKEAFMGIFGQVRASSVPANEAD